ncbi:MAG: ATP-binding protein [Eubacteriales bacterium]
MVKIIKNFFLKLPLIRSFRMRIFIVIFAIGIIPSAIMRYGILENYEERAINVRILEVQNQFKIIANHLLTYNYLQDTSSSVIQAELEQLSNLYDGRVLIINQNLKVIKDSYGIIEGKTIISEEVVRCIKGETVTYYDQDNGLIEIAIPITENVAITAKDSTQTTQVKGVMFVSVSTSSITAMDELLGKKAQLLEIVMAILIFGVAILTSKLLVLPFYKVTSAISEVKEGFTDETLSVPDYAETEHILDAFNQVIGRMRLLDESRQEFVSNVSHELKTPITSIKVLADSLIEMQDVPVELYQEFMVDIAAEIERENKIINDLLTLVKVDKSNADLNISGVQINDLLEILLKRLRPIARKRDIEVVFESLCSVVAEIDEMKITLAITNLVENAIKYNKEHGHVKVVLDADHQFFVIDIIDTGMGIPEEAYGHIYERFYRVDKSHSREIGGTGLGLAISRNIILMHRGAIKVDSVVDEGTVFTVKIPLFYIK